MLSNELEGTSREQTKAFCGELIDDVIVGGGWFEARRE